MHRLIALVQIVLCSLLCSACSVLPGRPPVVESHAIPDGETTTLGRVARASLSDNDESGFALLPVASAAFETRLALVGQAERTVDLQTYFIGDDNTGRYLLKRLGAAAARGVRVRVLIDDLYSHGSDRLLARFSAQPNVEVRLFNPFAVGRSSTFSRLFFSLNDLRRVNHRMHNKLFIADDALAVFGGRNSADEYFMRSGGGNFVDFDVLAAGKAVHDLSASFDDYWNSSFSYPIAAVVGSSDTADAAELQSRLESAEIPPLDETVPMRLQRYIDGPTELASGKLKLIGARARVVADPTDKIRGTRLLDRTGTVRDFVAGLMRSAKHEVFVISPYFVPGPLGMDAMRQLRAEGVQLRLLTNSLAATDEPSVHAGYVRYRKPMLELGVEIFELSPMLSRRANSLGRFASSVGMLHAKIEVIDRSRLFVGSMNMDNRSERYNTEIGVLIDSPELSAQFLELMDFKSSAYRLRLDRRGNDIQWVSEEGAQEKVWTSEPEAGWWLNLQSTIMGALVPEDWL